MLKHPVEVFIRFKEEQKNIRAFVAVTDEFMRPNDTALGKIASTLTEAGFVPFYSRPPERNETPFSDEEFQSLIDQMDQFEGPITVKIHDLEKNLYALEDAAEQLKDKFEPNYREHALAWMEFIFNDPDSTKLVKMDEKWCEAQIAELTQKTGEPADEDSDFVRFFRYISNRQRAKTTANLIARLEQVRETFNRLRVAHRMRDPNADVNILRQGYLLLMTAFDAAVFDMIRIAMRLHFFKLIARFGKKEVIPVAQWDKFGTIEEFQNRMIEKSLKGFYLKDLLEVIRKMGVAPTDWNRLSEMIQRRNLHVHNRGFVDERYLETDDSGVARFNIDKLSLGDMAVIDQDYFDSSLKLTMECIELIRDWVMAGVPIKKE